jgi:dTDP-4-amino-4,6-dideoxygalactose transaminase
MRVGRALNFGFHDSRQSIGPSINGKLSEYHAAIGLAGLDGWPVKRRGFVDAAIHYQLQSRAMGLGRRLVIDANHANPYALYAADSDGEALSVETALNDGIADTRRWYGGGLHRQPEFAHCPHGPLPVTGDVAGRLVGLPMSCDLSQDEIARIVGTIADCALKAS